MALIGPEGRMLTASGSTVEGAEDVSEMLTELFDALRSTAHRIISQWHVDDVWIAELEADYELKSDAQVRRLPRAIIWRSQASGSAVVHVYGAHEKDIRDLGEPAGAMLLGGRWIPPL